MEYLSWGLLIAGAVCIVQACRALAADAREGAYVTMGGQMLYSHTWYLGALLGAVGVATLPAVTWWWGLLLFATLIAMQWPVSRVVTALNLGREAPPPPASRGYAEFERKARNVDHKAQ